MVIVGKFLALMIIIIDVVIVFMSIFPPPQDRFGKPLIQGWDVEYRLVGGPSDGKRFNQRINLPIPHKKEDKADYVEKRICIDGQIYEFTKIVEVLSVDYVVFTWVSERKDLCDG